MNWILTRMGIRKDPMACARCEDTPKVKGWRFCRPCMNEQRSGRFRRPRI